MNMHTNIAQLRSRVPSKKTREVSKQHVLFSCRCNGFLADVKRTFTPSRIKTPAKSQARRQPDKNHRSKEQPSNRRERTPQPPSNQQPATAQADKASIHQGHATQNTSQAKQATPPTPKAKLLLHSWLYVFKHSQRQASHHLPSASRRAQVIQHDVP
jgi:hypothetical protein